MKALSSVRAGLVALSLTVAAGDALAHHSYAAFDRSRTVAITGVVKTVEWTNPHIWVYVDTKDEKGAMVRWQCEGGSPNTLTRQGWSKDSLKQGDQVTIDGYRAKDGSNTCNSSSVTLADGTKLFAGSSAENQR